MALLGPHLGEQVPLEQVHWGGGANFLLREEMSELVASIDSTFTRGEKTECAIELDPRSAEPGRMEFLAALGFTRLDQRVRDFDPPCRRRCIAYRAETTRRVMEEARAHGFRSVNLDLIYACRRGRASTASIRTLDEVLALEPDRIALYNYAHLQNSSSRSGASSKPSCLRPSSSSS